jgi:two-component system response regulator
MDKKKKYMDVKTEILLVEDNHSDAFLFIRALRKKSIKERVHTVRDGEEAINFLFDEKTGACIEQNRPRVIFLDLKLPKLNGLEVLEIIKKDHRTNAIPVVILTSSSEESDIKKAYELGVNSYLVKPVDMDFYTQTISRLTYYWLEMNRPLKN